MNVTGCSSFYWPTETEEENNDVIISDSMCHCLSWMPTNTNGSSPLLLAASFQSGIAIYNITLPLKASSSELSGNSGAPDQPQAKPSETIYVNPIAGAKTSRRGNVVAPQSSTVEWINCGEGVLPFLATIFHSKKEMKMHVRSFDVPSYGHTKYEDNISLGRVCEGTFSIPDDIVSEFYGNSIMGTVVAHRNGSLTSFCLSSRFQSERKMHPIIHSNSIPVASNALGLTSIGSPLHSYDDVLHVHTSLQFVRNGQWELPCFRYWLCLSSAGDKKDKSSISKSNEEEDNSDFPTGGATISLVCDLTCSSSSSTTLAPRRIVRDNSGKYCTVLFASAGPVEKQGLSSSVSDNHTIAFATMEIRGTDDGIDTFNLHRARDASFIPGLEGCVEPSLLALDNDGKALRKCSLTNIEEDLKSEGQAIQIFKHGSANDQNLSVDRFFVVSRRILFICSRKADGKKCLFIGGSIKSLKAGSSKALVRKKTSKLWLDRGEVVLSLTELPSNEEGGGTTNVAIATTSRVMIVSCATSLQILSEAHTTLKCGSLSPMGSNCVAFLDAGSGGSICLKYLSCYESNNRGLICNIPGNLSKFDSTLLLAIRPDRIIYLPIRFEWKLSEQGDEDRLISVPCPLTKPALLLEPLVANALGQGEDDRTPDISLRTLLERFGPKLTANPHGDNEGLGTLGAGITAGVYAMLGSKLNVHLKTGGDDKMVAPWIPSILKNAGSQGSLNQPSVQSSGALNRPRNLLLEITNLATLHQDAKSEPDEFWSKELDETKHVW